MSTITNLFEEAVKKYGDNPYLWEKKTNQYESSTYKEIHIRVYNFAAGLIQLGIQKGDRIALISEGRNDWVVSELGILYCGAVNVPLSVKLTESAEIEFRLKHSGARMVIASKNQVNKLNPIKKSFSCLEKIILLDPQEQYEIDEIYFEDVISLGKEYLFNNKTEFDKIWKSIKPEYPANICYTSGTTSDPKGIVLSHGNYTANAEQSLSLMDVPEWYVTLLILPWDHAFAHSVGIYALMRAGASIASVQAGSTAMETLKNIPLNIKETRPHFILSVPALAKNFRKNIESGVAAKGRIINSLFNFGLKLAYFYNGSDWKEKGKGLRILVKPLYSLIDKIIFKKVRENFGGHLRFFVGGGALLDSELQRFFYAIGIPMFQGYGLTEAAPVISCNSERKHKFGSSGYVVTKLELKICDENGFELPRLEKGEIVVRGENVMTGYWKNQESTIETIKNGWLYTGDMGYMDKDNFLFVQGRFKSLLIADDGEKYCPEGIEETFVGQSYLIDQCMLYNNQNPYTVCLLVPNKEAVAHWLAEKQLDITSDNAICTALKLLEAEISKYRSGQKFGNMFPQRWIPAAIGIIDNPFTEENHMLNSTLKMVRGKIAEHYISSIEFLYKPEAKDICNIENKNSMRRILSDSK